MIRLNEGIIMAAVALAIAGCATNHPLPANRRETVSILVTPGDAAQEYTVQATIANMVSSDTLPRSRILTTNVVDLLQCAGQADVLSAPRVTVFAGQWAEIRVCSTNTPSTFSVETHIGEEKVTLTHPAGLVFRVKVQPITARRVQVRGLLSIGSEDASGSMHHHCATPFLADCELDTPTVILEREYTIPRTSNPYILTEKWETPDGTTNTSTLPSRNRAGK